MIAICERTSIEITLENATNYAVYALLRLFSIIDCIDSLLSAVQSLIMSLDKQLLLVT